MKTIVLILIVRLKKQCSQYFQHGLLPNLIGSQDMLTVSRHWETVQNICRYFRRYNIISILQNLDAEFIVPECNLESKQVIHPCREMCHHFRKACTKIILPRSLVIGKLPRNIF